MLCLSYHFYHNLVQNADDLEIGNILSELLTEPLSGSMTTHGQWLWLEKDGLEGPKVPTVGEPWSILYALSSSFTESWIYISNNYISNYFIYLQRYVVTASKKSKFYKITY